MTKHKNKLIAALVIIFLLTAAWFWGGADNIYIPTAEQLSPAPAPALVETHPAQRDPADPDDIIIGNDSFYVTLSVCVRMLQYNMHLLHSDQHELVPEDGWIFPPTQVIAYEGESVFNILQREMRRNRIHMASRITPLFNSAYVEAINNLFEFDAGSLSGWKYSVNGWFPNFGSSRYILQAGDVIEWHYTLDLGRDLGVNWTDSNE